MSLTPDISQSILHALERGSAMAEERSVEGERLLAALFATLIGELDEDARNEAFAMAAMSPSPIIRAALVETAARNPDWAVSIEYLEWVMGDYSDAAALAINHALKPDQRVPIDFVAGMSGSGRPMSHVLSLSIRDIIAEDRAESVRRQMPPGLPKVRAGLDNMVEVPAATVSLGVDSTGLTSDAWFTPELNPSREVHIPRFWIDRAPVINTEYDAFCVAIAEQGHVYCHPDEPTNKLHRRSTYGDARFGPDHPVCGIDWYDAVGYARFTGKKLPTVDQWERVALDVNRPVTDSPLGHGAVRAFAQEIKSIEDWKELLRTITNTYPAVTTIPVSDPANPVTASGIRGLIGNVWEMTRSRFVDGDELVPMLRGMDSSSIVGDWTAWIAIKGGAWTSVGELLHPQFTGRRFVLHRSLDVGFRCVVEDA